MAPPETLYIPGCESDGASCYPTPSTISAETTETMEETTITTDGPDVASKAAETNSSAQTILGLLRSCRVPVKSSRRAQCASKALKGLNDHQIMKILQVDSLLIAQNPEKMVRPLLDKWDTHKSLNLSTLGLPLQWKGIQAAVNYLRLLDSDAKTSHLDPIAKRVAQVMLHLNYNELCETPEGHCSLLPGKSKKTSVLEAIIGCYPDDPRISNSQQARHDRITTFHVRRGEWWWRLARNFGAGLLFTADNSLMGTMCNHTFTNAQIDVLVTLILKTRPASIRLFNELDHVVKLLMFEEVRNDMRRTILDKEVGLLGIQNLAQVCKDDQIALACQNVEIPWVVLSSKANAGQVLLPT
ncbi:serine-proline rich protein [Penicillium herquei]|nr:serine-proline rich protein [Penicillium herquei]